MWWMNSSMEPRRKSTQLIDGEMKGIMDNYYSQETKNLSHKERSTLKIS